MFTKKNKSSKNRTRKIRYVITDYTKNAAKRLGVTIKPSSNPEKKLDVYKNGKKIATCGARGYNDYPTFWKKFGNVFFTHAGLIMRMPGTFNPRIAKHIAMRWSL